MDEFPNVGSVYKSMGATFIIDKIDPDGWIFVRNRKTQAKHRISLKALRKKYHFVSPS